MLELLKRVCELLQEQNIDYMLSGSLALNVYSIPRMTRDIDLVVRMKIEDVDNFVKAFEQDFYCYQPSIEEEIRKKGMFNLIELQSSIKIDFIICKDTLYRKTEFERRRKTTTLGFESWIVSVEDLILSKLIWIQELQSTKQIEDIQSLLEYPTLDMAYVKHWIADLHLKTFDLL